jgi:hypothetical protein
MRECENAVVSVVCYVMVELLARLLCSVEEVLIRVHRENVMQPLFDHRRPFPAFGYDNDLIPVGLRVFLLIEQKRLIT